MDLRGVDRHPVDFLQGLNVRVGPHEFHYGVDTARRARLGPLGAPGGLPGDFRPPRIYSDAPDEHVRYLLLTRAAFECCQRMGFAPESCTRTTGIPRSPRCCCGTAYAWDRGVFGATKSVFTIHNIGYQGVFSASRAGELAPGVGVEMLPPGDLRGRAESDAARVMYADAVTTVSPTYARKSARRGRPRTR